jgi:hypothetical protein
MKNQFDRKVRPTPNWQVGDRVWLNSKNISTTRPSPKLDHKWLGPFNIIKKISRSAYKLTLTISMKGVHPVFHVSLLRKHSRDTIDERHQTEPVAITINDEEEWEVQEILDCRKRYNKTEYLVLWKGFSAEHNSWEPEINLNNSKELLNEFNKKFPDASSRHKRTRRRVRG